ncbi:1-deoxy-D-xylulose-5-phosphate synthase N-terminal domain-containing protein [Spiroplasma endosymbiont of Amphibalanus improvisus]|uniref:1-deoxy-D-xylulose-5-phosphate synthase N-terminal domain-containing protein n=1 Tax=Spiroplasma endosymbiont of Amphibalanus improvisus TaxID=3066327 RepID=UPI00313F01C4
MNYKDYKNQKDLIHLKTQDLKLLAEDIKKELIKICYENNAHLGSNLGVLELTISLLKTFDLDENNKIFFDTGHMSYIYKMLTDRKDKFNLIKKQNGISGFPEFNESKYDYFSAGHSGTALSTAIGYSFDSQVKNLIVIIGDMSFFNSINLASLNYLSMNPINNLTIVVNDNQMGIDQFKSVIQKKGNLKKISQAFNLNYFGPYDGHNFLDLKKVWMLPKVSNKLIHLKTIKGNGLNVKASPTNFHKVSLKNENFELKPCFLVNSYLLDIFKNIKFYVLNAGMTSPLCLTSFYKKYPNYAIDTGMNEEGLFLIASGLILNNQKVVIAIYSTFLQRCYDQLVHDIVRNQLNPLILIDRAGLAFNDGVSHHGIYDVALLKSISNQIIICQPSTQLELKKLMTLGMHNKKYPFVIRYNNEDLPLNSTSQIQSIGDFILLIKNTANKKVLITFGPSVLEGKKIIESNNLKYDLINAVFISNHNIKLFNFLINSHYKKVIFYEPILNNVGIGSDFLKFLKNKTHNHKIEIYTFENNHICHGDVETILLQNNMSLKNILLSD